MYQGRTVAKPGKVLGHEPIGVIEEVGSAVTSFKKEDRVVVTFNVACGHFMNCVRGFTSACLTVNPEIAGGAFGYAKMGIYPAPWTAVGKGLNHWNRADPSEEDNFNAQGYDNCRHSKAKLYSKSQDLY